MFAINVYVLKWRFILLVSVVLFAVFNLNYVFCQPFTPSFTLVYTRGNGRIGDIALTSSGDILFSNYPIKPGRLWLLSGGFEKLVYEVPKATYDLYGVAVSGDGDIYVSCPYTGEILRIVRGAVFTVYVSASKNVGPLALAPNGTLYFAELIPTEGYQSIFRLTPQNIVTASGSMSAVPIFTSPITIGGMAFNSKGELFFSDGPRGRLWKVVDGMPILYVDRRGWSTMYGIAFDKYDNLYFCDWSSPGSIYYLDFRFNIVYRVVDGNNVPIAGASVLVMMPDGSSRMFISNSTGHVALTKALPGTYVLNVSWYGIPVGSFKFEESTSRSRDLVCKVFNVKLTAKDDTGKVLKDCLLEVTLPNGTIVKLPSPASLPRIPNGIMIVHTFYRGIEVAEPIQVNVSSNLDISIPCKVYSLSMRLLDPDGKPLKDALMKVNLDGSIIVNQSYPESGITIEGLLSGNCMIEANFRGFTVAKSSFKLDGSRNIFLTANVSRIVVKVRDLLGFPMQGVRVDLTLPDGSTMNGFTDTEGSFKTGWLPTGNVSIVLSSGFEKKVFSLTLDKSLIEVSQTFIFSWTTVSLTIVITLLALIVAPPSRRIIKRAFPIEVSLEVRHNISEAYIEFLSSRRLNVEEALEYRKGIVSILMGEAKVLPRLEDTVDHSVFLISDASTIPPRRELHVLVDSSNLEDVKIISKLIKEYSGKTGLKTIGIIVCREVTDDLLNLLRGLKDVEVFFITRGNLSV